MKLHSEMIQMEDLNGELRPNFVLYLDTQRTNDVQKDTLYSACDFSHLVGSNDADAILAFLIPMLSELVYTAYGEKPQFYGEKKPLTEYSRTGFDPNCLNGVKGHKLK